MAHKVFICHSSTDKAVADAACAALEAQRIPCWIAPRDILAGEEYGESIIEAIAECQIMLLVFSAHANDSPQVRREIERGVSKGKIIVPFRIEDIMPSRAMEFALSNTHWLDALTPPMESYLMQLCDTMSRLIQKHTVAETPLWRPPEMAAQSAPESTNAGRAVKPESDFVQPGVSSEAPAAEPRIGTGRVTTHTGSGVEPQAQPVVERGAEAPVTAWRKVPVWVWILVPVGLIAVFALGRVFGPGSSSRPRTVPTDVKSSNPPVVAVPATESAKPSHGESSVQLPAKQGAQAALPSTKAGVAAARPEASTQPGTSTAEGSQPSTPTKSNAETAMQQANALLDQHRYGDAAPLLGVACAGGDAIACDRLGRLNQAGEGVAANPTLAVTLYIKACDANLGEACRDVGTMYTNGAGVAQDFPRAATLLTKACSLGVIGCNNLGNLYSAGNGVAQNFGQAATLYLKACNGGIGMGCSNLARLYAHGQGVVQSYAQAATFMSKGCDGGVADACSTLGTVYRDGVGVEKDLSKARQYLSKGCSMGDQHGCDKLKQLQ